MCVPQHLKPAGYTATTHNIRVTVDPVYLEEHSDPGADHYHWAYEVVIENKGNRTVQLRRRYWEITDGNGHRQEVKGLGVVGEEPVLEPGEEFRYMSGVPLRTPSGFMVGKYFFDLEPEGSLEVDVPAFPLDLPERTTSLH